MNPSATADGRTPPLWPHTLLAPALAGAAVLLALAAPPHVGVGLALFAGAVCIGSALVLARRVRRGEREVHELDLQLLQSQKLAAIGELSSGIAHEINNPLAIITQELDLVREIAGEGPDVTAADLAEARDSLAEIGRQVDRCRLVTHKLLNFARKMEPVLQEEALDQVIEDMALLAEREAAGRGLAIVRDYAPGLPPIRTDVPLLRQVILNLLTNALAATPKGGTITVSTRRDEKTICIEVRDTGCGIPPENMQKIFNPFFTTKEPGKGTGLGLSLAHGIVTRLGGTLAAESRPGQGAAFTVTLPL
ncbi:integral membrane sensor signal transduction histidine kinase [Solidesulfovibrio carbinoliphilus subsp. oakridgensis]|uniref:histidine kinase n=1 Tax=Solidesulfovibrio carbinoliphilus subsp. oakridgensis TaxID=694327 RepID=G7QBG6_9BACT|nr:ATP-binding protein [Solidesulfovibrio carbinoliphilus]EHJ49389.1 integral membrane sensor signal transduction histidine kinase [Solidesulfovibrio carbinoliphilus subsp. oakridgensis]